MKYVVLPLQNQGVGESRGILFGRNYVEVFFANGYWDFLGHVSFGVFFFLCFVGFLTPWLL